MVSSCVQNYSLINFSYIYRVKAEAVKQPQKATHFLTSAGGGLLSGSFIRKLPEQQINPINPVYPVKKTKKSFRLFNPACPACPAGPADRTGV